MATFKDGHFYCKVHGDLGAHDTAIEQQTVLYSGEDNIDGFMCMRCLGNEYAQHLQDAQAEAAQAENAKPRTIYIASSVSLFDTPAYEEIRALVASSYPQDTLIFAKGLYEGSQEWLAKWPKLAKTVDILLFFTHDSWIGKGVYKEMCDIEKQGKPIFFVELDGTHHKLSSIPVDIDFTSALVDGITFEFNTASWRQYVHISFSEPTEDINSGLSMRQYP